MQEAGCETWSQVLLKFTLAHKAVTCVIPGTGNPDHMAENCRAGDGAMLEESLVKKLAAYLKVGQASACRFSMLAPYNANPTG